jgi:sulfatase maturation enzyme AslB (radical SAM superfamily)
MTSNLGKIFPIRTATACKLKWTWSTVCLPWGISSSCHRTAYEPITPTTFSNFHNTDLKQKERQQMLNGQWPDSSCGYCRNIEEAGGFSDRMLHLSIPGYIPTELHTDPTAVNVSPRILEVYLNNTCNLACLYCFEGNSSKIDAENKKFGQFEQDGVVLPADFVNKTDELFPVFFDWLTENYHTIERLNILGGEPFFQKEFDTLIEFLQNNKNPNCEISIVSNLMLPRKMLVKYIDIFKLMISEHKIKRLDITCSIDCWGDQQEYVRTGLNLEAWSENFEYLLEQKWLTVNINQVVTTLTIKTMPELLERLQVWSKKKQIGHYFGVAAPGPSYFIPKIFGPGEFDKDFEKIIQLMENSGVALEYMRGIQHEYLHSTADPTEIKKLIVFLNEKDRRRNTNWRELFPWLEKYVV